jgi:4-diphosphocytidyl-2-C-methyl-D-erythritol kinase
MLSAQLADAVVVWAPAKVNLFLEVRAKRTDGYHEIATLMVTVSLHDTLEFKEEATGEIRLSSDHPHLSTGPDNLIWRAAELLRQRTGTRRGVRMELTKRIPMAAGLAGGSSDAAAALAGLNQLWRLGLKDSELAALGAELGSDVAFFFAAPAAWCTGRGERVTPLTLGGPLWFVLACPAVGLSTAAVYRGVSVPEQPRSGHEVCDAVARGEPGAIGEQLHNRLQPVAEQLCPTVAAIQARLAQLGAAGSMMSGSGTSLFALCRDHDEALRVARGLQTDSDETSPWREGMKQFIVRSCV